ncbi:glycosyl hydrolase family 18 protein [uncultured Oscillibacter sp.]|uniref:glycosyl hydrolase family 18 protein n=1 Tax=uncultured Oscillibacter sp. TaxID=876091 RepID=UPI002614825B|nr:glycosyl hydrolase family 18 protein [uncultured Oscillibacter sp.]
MERKKRIYCALGGFLLGVLTSSLIWSYIARIPAGQEGESRSDVSAEASDEAPDVSPPSELGTSRGEPAGSTAPESPADIWNSAAVYTGGDTVCYQGRRYRAKWWTQGEQPGGSDVWEDLGILDGQVVQPEGVGSVPIDASEPRDTALTDFKVVGYYPSWKPDKLRSVDFGVLTHVCYAFAIPTAEGGLRALENPEAAETLIRSAHENGARVLLSVGGWSYNDVPLENVFMEAAADDAKRLRLAESILAMCEEYGFDGVDMDWEHPRVDGDSARRYEALMLTLSERLHAQGKLLTAAVLSGATADGNIYYDAAAHTNAVLNAVDFINVMAYDGGDGERHSQYQFAVDCGTYWRETRGLPAHKVVLGVPFYTRPGWADYGTIVAAVPEASARDHVLYNGMEVYYNGVDTIAEKTRYAREHLGGIMIWELTQDTAGREESLLQTIGNACKQP